MARSVQSGIVTDPDGYEWAFVAPSHHGRWWVWPLNRIAAF